jgi:hypothetical protein
MRCSRRNRTERWRSLVTLSGCYLVVVIVFMSAWNPGAIAKEIPSQVTVTLKDSDDRVVLYGDSATLHVDIESSRGIGEATLVRNGNRWPKKVVLRLQLQGLESLQIKSGEQTIHAQVSSYPPVTVRQWINSDEAAPISTAHPAWIAIQRCAGRPSSLMPKGAFEIVVPTCILQDRAGEIKIQWIDYYR